MIAIQTIQTGFLYPPQFQLCRYIKEKFAVAAAAALGSKDLYEFLFMQIAKKIFISGLFAQCATIFHPSIGDAGVSITSYNIFQF